MNYAQARTWLDGLVGEARSAAKPSLDRMRALLAALGDPHRAYPSIHVGGTSGKGSTATMIAAALQAHGKRVGLHVKPHLYEPTERAVVDGAAIAFEAFATLAREVRAAAEGLGRAQGAVSYYEATLALALLHFARERVDVAVVEVGLGGTFDGTNVLEPLVSVVTNVGYDHTEILGDSLEEIAEQKAGIARAGVPMISDVAPGAARARIALRCASVGAPLALVSECTRVLDLGGDPTRRLVRVRTTQAEYDLTLRALGAMQRRNAATAILALEALPPELRPSPETVARGIGAAMPPGRMDVSGEDRRVVFDVAHNPEKSAALAEALRETFPRRRFVFVTAIARSKDAPGTLAPLLPLAERVVCTSWPDADRAAHPPGALAAIAVRGRVLASVVPQPREALAFARDLAGEAGIVVVTGSTRVVGALRRDDRD